MLALDDTVGRVLDYLKETGLDDDTLVVYMGDNGFLLGEHGLIDKRHAYEESMRVGLRRCKANGTLPPTLPRKAGEGGPHRARRSGGAWRRFHERGLTACTKRGLAA